MGRSRPDEAPAVRRRGRTAVRDGLCGRGSASARVRPHTASRQLLSLGRQGWLQDLSFTTAGVLYAAMAVGLSRAKTPTTKAGPALIGAAAVGLLGAGAFKTDPVSGYPPGTPDAFTRHTAHGALHDLLSAPTFLGLPAAALVYARAFRRDHERGWAAYSAATGAGMLDVRLGQRRVQPGAGPRALWRADPACLHHPGVLVADRSRASRAPDGAHSPATGPRPAPSANARGRAPHYSWR